MVSDGHSRHDHGKLRWPEKTSANTIPTPYQIFDQRKGSPYSKRRFYELVKLYHPDRHDHIIASNGLSYATKLERYRLVVAANDILSDPIKRSAYDCYGAGWNGAPDVKKPRDASDPASSWGGSNAWGWGGGTEGPSQNATWEDWERWYQRDAKGPQEPRYVSNSAFVGLIVAFAFIGGIGQVTRAGTYGVSFVEQRDALHNNISKDLIRRRKETTTAYGSREERIDSFLRQRDPVGYGVVDPKEMSYRKLLPPPEICSSDDIKQRQMDVYQQKSKSEEDKNG
ncbi:related to J domain-containing protein 1 [Rhynchosporium agropyri]|uniref:Related to J domain-containing protein 1 n=1 Tax=Rhynchosporium agropyri TaxID=914238 RepID=A0A1E1LGM5_9HELO|nr:related to J domain-containing protein 1 [Rhynchosporium agropyri]